MGQRINPRTDQASLEHDTSSDYAPEPNLDDRSETDVKQQDDILNDYDLRVNDDNLSFHFNDGKVCTCLQDCRAINGDGDDYVDWLSCIGCKGWQCYHHINEVIEVDLYEQDPELLTKTPIICKLCVTLFTDTIKIQIDYLESMLEAYFGEEGPRSSERLAKSNDG